MQTITVTGIGAKMLKLSDGSFLGVSKPLTLKDFEKGKTYAVEITMNGTFKNVSKISAAPQQAAPVAVAEKPAAVKPSPIAKTEYKPRDYDAEARGKTRCAMFEAALQSPVVANLVLTVNGLDKALEIVKQAADFGFAYVFPEDDK